MFKGHLPGRFFAKIAINHPGLLHLLIPLKRLDCLCSRAAKEPVRIGDIEIELAKRPLKFRDVGGMDVRWQWKASELHVDLSQLSVTDGCSGSG